jgi:hypothetical protein
MIISAVAAGSENDPEKVGLPALIDVRLIPIACSDDNVSQLMSSIKTPKTHLLSSFSAQRSLTNFHSICPEVIEVLDRYATSTGNNQPSQWTARSGGSIGRAKTRRIYAGVVHIVALYDGVLFKRGTGGGEAAGSPSFFTAAGGKGK